MVGTLAPDSGLGRGRWLAAQPYISPLAIFATPLSDAAVQLAGALSNGTQAVDAGLDGHLAATLDGVDLLAEWIQSSALAGVGKQAQLVIAAARRNGG